MCGLAVVLGAHASLSDSRIDSVFSSMRHRGPDDQGLYQSADILMCHSRLAIEGARDVGKQPISSQDGRYIVIVNGELYPYRSIRESMEGWGYVFQGDCDSELALALYLRYGDEFVHHLRGEYVVIIWDTQTRRLLAVRDRFGIKPLVYSKSHSCLYLASEAKTLFALGFSSDWSLEGLTNSFSFQYLLPGNSLFAGVKLLPPAHKLVICDDAVEQSAYWTPSFSTYERQSQDALQAEVHNMLDAAVKMRLPSSYRSAFTLSGGLDSSAIVALAKKHVKYDLDCYCVSFDDENYDEYVLAKQFAKDLGVRLKKVDVSRDDLVLGLSNAAYFSEGLAGNGQYVGKHMLYQKIASDGYRVVMSGEGADEAFMGYAHLVQNYTETTPGLKDRETLLQSISASGKLQKGLMLGEVNSESSQYPNFIRAKINFCNMLFPLFSDDFQEVFVEEKKRALVSLSQLQSSYSSCPDSTVRCALLWQNLVLPGYILKTLGDGMEMASSLEARLPFLDHKLFELALSIPTMKKISGIQGKVILRESMSGTLPSYICKRNKHPFISPPISAKLLPTTKDYIFDSLTNHGMQASGVFNLGRVKYFLKQWHSSGIAKKASYDPVIMILLSFSALQNHFTLTDAK